MYHFPFTPISANLLSLIYCWGSIPAQVNACTNLRVHIGKIIIVMLAAQHTSVKIVVLTSG